ncbi:MAG: PP2C family protein-serine/threonine phosphatase [Betaproteobacteria bacterium]
MNARRFSFAAVSHPGSARPSNEDCVAAGGWLPDNDLAAAKTLEGPLEPPFACVVADGMGGHAAGERASRFAAERLAKLLRAGPRSDVAGAIRRVNGAIFEEMRGDTALAGMGTTVAGLVASRSDVCVFNVGDSRAYKVDAKGLRQLSVDDSSDPGWKPGSNFARSGFLTQCLGGAERLTEVAPHLYREAAMPGATYLLCTDGLYETLDEEQIRALVGPDLAASASEILRVALRHFSSDNLTVALVRLD